MKTIKNTNAKVAALFICAILINPLTACANSQTSATSPTQQAPAPVEGEPEALTTKIDYYKNRYNLKTVDQKLVDNRGDGFKDLYGVRNFRTVLTGVVYRGGANNYYHKENARDNSNPLPNDGMANLCEEGFGTAVYLYTTNFSTAPKSVDCQSAQASQQSLKYYQYSPQDRTADGQKVLEMIYERLTTANNDPIYLHCWNGWHASGFISAITLMQFCDYSAEKAVAYWDRNTDGNNKAPAYEKIRQRIRDFKPYNNLKIDAATKAKVCL